MRHALGHVVRERRAGHALTLRQVAARSTIALGYLSEVERGTKEISSELLEALAGALEATVAELLRDSCALLERPLERPKVADSAVGAPPHSDDEQPWPLRTPHPTDSGAPADSWRAPAAA